MRVSRRQPSPFQSPVPTSGCNPMKIWSKGTPMERTADAIIIGAGVMGTSTAFQLIQRGVKRVVVLEKSTVAAGSSGKSSDLVRMHYTFLPELRLALASLARFQEWSERVGGRWGFTTRPLASSN